MRTRAYRCRRRRGDRARPGDTDEVTPNFRRRMTLGVLAVLVLVAVLYAVAR
ncbi:hypothetical protein H9L10_00830 [Phycicoccus endophyticus]|uniref:Uncharacterized protein n=1 Tax=Phycicoccus endophyticus TaxID=1690220 RepID=A0A7G9R270_9MICO|nr:hypothetical protein [Phycicoccus endophyticus]NHI19652.1 hypothetical protein [Phycicoccus endophyticus]QNN49695.1 hypothetical protein H9L10_00830 [Phycicoccus endophyticus]